MADKEVHTVLNPKRGKFRRFSITVDEDPAVVTVGTRAESFVQAKHTNVSIQAEGDPLSAFECLIEVTYANGEVRTFVDMLVVLDLSGAYHHIYNVGIQTQSS